MFVKKVKYQDKPVQVLNKGFDHSPGPTFHFVPCPVHTVILVNICYLVNLHFHGYDVCHMKKQGHWEPGCFKYSRWDLFLFLRTMNLAFGNLTWQKIHGQELCFLILARRQGVRPSSQVAKQQQCPWTCHTPLMKARAFMSPALWSHSMKLLLHWCTAWKRSPELARSPSKVFYEVRDSSEET